MSNEKNAAMVAVMVLVTVLLRFAPFWLFGGGRKLPPVLARLGKKLPKATMAMLVVYCLKGVCLTTSPYGIPELLGCAAVVGLHVWKRSTLLSIAGGTILYMLLVQLVF